MMRRAVHASLMVVLILAAAGAAAQATAPELPDTPVGARLRGFLDALNTGDSAAWAAYVLSEQKARDSADVFARRIGLFRMLWENHAGLELEAIKDASDYRISVVARSVDPRAEFEWLEIMLQIASEPPHGLEAMGLQPTSDPSEKLPEGPLTDQQMAAYFDEQIDRMVADGRFSGAVIVARKGKPIYNRVEGMANLSFEAPNRLDTKFNLGSMNKMFTGVAIAQLAEQGKLAFTDTVGKFLPDYPNPDVRSKVTIHHLLTHTSGMGDYWEKLFECRFHAVRTVQQLADLTASDSLEFEPGSRFRYSNAGPVVLGLIIEKLSGQDYFDYIREHVTGPCGMANTDSYEVDDPVPNLAIGYSYSDLAFNRSDKPRANYFLHAARGGPAGGGYSTVEDLIKFADGLLTGKLVGTAYVDTLTTAKADVTPEGGYGYLFGERLESGHRVVGHTGGAPGISAVLRIYTDLGYEVAVLSNMDGGSNQVADRIDRLLLKD